MNESHYTPESLEIPFGYCHCGCGQKTNLIPYNDPKRGYVKGQPFFFIRGHVFKNKPEDIWRLFDKINEDDGCWIWTGCKTSDNYGLFTIGGKQMLVHRISWIVTNGEIPEGYFVCHHCDNPVCGNPKHLFLGTNQDNIKDMIRKGRNTRGEKCWNAKLNEDKVKEILKIKRETNLSNTKIAKLFGMTRSPIDNIFSGKSWKHVPRLFS